MKRRLCSLARTSSRNASSQPFNTRAYATVAAVAPSPPSSESAFASAPPIQRYHPSQPPSYKPIDVRKSQLLRQYTSLLRSAPLLLFIQHNNLIAQEWAALRRELAVALAKLAPDASPSIADGIKLGVISTRIFATALRLVESHQPRSGEAASSPTHATEQHAQILDHYLSKAAYESAQLAKEENNEATVPLHSLLKGPIAVVSFSDVTPEHLAAVISVLAPTKGAKSAFPAPKRKTNPSYYEPQVQTALQKILLLGARVEESTDAGVVKTRTLDGPGIQWLGGLNGGLEGMRAQLVNTLQSAGMGLTSTLEGAGRNLWITMESRRMDMDESSKPEDQ